MDGNFQADHSHERPATMVVCNTFLLHWHAVHQLPHDACTACIIYCVHMHATGLPHLSPPISMDSSCGQNPTQGSIHFFLPVALSRFAVYRAPGMHAHVHTYHMHKKPPPFDTYTPFCSTLKYVL